MKTLIGIDPGKEGYLVRYFPSSGKVDVVSTISLLDIDWKNLRKNNLLVVAEKVQPRPAQSLRSVVTSCVNYGILKAVLHILDFRVAWVTPQQWQKELGLSKRWTRPKGLTDEQYASYKYNERKRWHKRVVKKITGIDYKFTLKNADAFLILEYARRLTGERKCGD